MKHKPELFFLTGLWASFVAVVFAGTLLLPPSKKLADNSTALLYKVAMNEELRRPMSMPVTGKMISANLGTMELSLYEDGVLINTFPILSRGKEGTAWETPAGKYSIQTKELKHLSSIGGTWMPYSMQFYGNFFIHGWPTYQNGTSVPKGYSGGCIRLSTPDSKIVYNFASLGTRMLVVGGVSSELFATSSRYYLHTPPDEESAGVLPHVGATSFVVADAVTGDVLWERNAEKKINPGALVSLVTALTAVETVNQYKIVRMGELILGKSVLRKYGSDAPDEIPVGTLIYPLLFESNDTAAKVFEREHGVKKFVSYMNEKASAIGMSESSFRGGLTTDNSTTTVEDLQKLLRYVHSFKHFLIDASMATERIIVDEGGKGRYQWQNKNPWIQSSDASYRGGIGKKETDGSGSGMLLFSLPVSEFGDRTISVVIFDSPDIETDVRVLKKFVTDHFVYGIERGTEFTREGDEPIPSLLQRAKKLLDLERLLQEEIIYERDV